MEIDVFISHHTKTSLHIVEAIANKLENVGIRCWYAPRNTEGAYAGNIVEAINSCKIFILVLNKEAAKSFDVLNEINMVSDRLRDGQNVEVIPFHTGGPKKEICGDMQYYIGRMHWIDAVTPPMYQRIDELVEKICLSLGKKDLISNKSNQSSEYKLINRMPEVRDVFDGRDETIEQIKDEFANGNKTIFIEGIGGIGKTELAKQYATRYKQDYDTIVFARYTQDLEHLIIDDNEIKIEGLTKKDDESNEEYFERKLGILKSIGNERTLLIIDNFDIDSDEKLSEILTGNYYVIITTRNQHQGYKTIKVGPIKDEQKLFSIFEKNYNSTLSEEDKIYVKEIFELIEYHTYAIELIAKQMEASFIDAKEMLKIMREGNLEKAVTEDIYGRDSMKSAFSHICSLFSVGNLSDKEKQILMYLSLMGINGVPANKFKEWCELDNFNEINSLIRKSWIRKEENRISIHPLVKEVIWSEMKPNLENCEKFLEKFSSYFIRSFGRPVSENLSVLSCAYSVLEYFSDEPDRPLNTFEPICGYLWQVGKFEDSQNYYMKLYETMAKKHGEYSDEAGMCAVRCAGAYYNAGMFEESIPWYRKGLEILKKSSDEESLELALAYEKVARTYTFKGNEDYEKAEKLFNEAINIRNRLIERAKNGENIKSIETVYKFGIGEAECGTLMTLMEIGRLYQAKGDFEKAYEYAKEFTEKYSNHRLMNKSNLAYGYYDSSLCLLKISQKELDIPKKEKMLYEAEEMMKKVQDINNETRGDVAMDTISSEELLGDIYAEKKDYGNASNCYLNVLNMLEKNFKYKTDYIERIKLKMKFERNIENE